MFWFVRMFLSNARRKFKYYILYLSSLFLVYCILTRVINIYAVKPKSYVNLKHVVVHIDLKGSPPKMTYLVSLLPILSMYGVNAILLEYEDMFPFINDIANISSVNAYTRTELLTFINTAKTLEMEIIPLIQTFGHMEYVLKLEQFAHLREQKTIPKDICPSNPESRKLITTMLQQVFDLHAFIQPLDHIHIGCDEVRNINVCPKCQERKLKSTDLFADHVKEVSSIIQDIIPDTKVLIWGDMLLGLRKPLTNYFFNVDAVSWEYGAYPKFSHIYFYNLHKSFNNIWIASAYKGADGNNATIPDIKKRFQNHLSWMKFILDYKFGGEKRVHTFEGIILTGWSRYNHQDPQCELLPIAMPSLILNLLLIKTFEKGIEYGDLDLHYCDFYKKYLDKDFSYIFQNHGDTNKKCAFENTLLYEEQEKLFNHTLIHNCLHILHLRETQCRSIDSNVDLKSTFKHCKKALMKLMRLKSSLEKFMIKYYKNPIVKSYIDDVVEAPANKIRKKMKYVKQNCH